MEIRHTFSICAYKDSPYLEACIRSVTGQSVPARVILCTSTPSSYLEGLAEKYRIPMFVRDGESGIGEDWNFAFEQADGDYVTIAHQDDLYGRDYLKTFLGYQRRYPDISLFATDYVTVRGKKVIPIERLTLVKKLLRIPLRAPWLNHISMVKKSSLLFGNSICCPACTYRKDKAEVPFFRPDLHFALDWDKLITLAEEPGRFICAEKPLVFHRLHPDAATNVCMKGAQRFAEESMMFKRMWPKAAAEFFMKYYRKAYDSYQV